MNKNHQQPNVLFFATFPFPMKTTIRGEEVNLWDYFVEIEAPDIEVAKHLMTVNFGQYVQIHTEEGFKGPENKRHLPNVFHAIDFFPMGVFAQLHAKRDNYFVLNPTPTLLVSFGHLPRQWERAIRFTGSAEDVCKYANDRPGDELLVSDGKRVLFDWLTDKSHNPPLSWIPQKF